MDDALRGMLADLAREGEERDAAEPDRLKRRRNLEPASAELLHVIVASMSPAKVMEIGTSNGVSTLWLADALRASRFPLLSVDTDALALEEARANLERAGLSFLVELVHGDGGDVLASLEDGGLDLVFLDAERTQYLSWWPHPLRVLRPGGLLVIDNALSHPGEVHEFCARLAGTRGVETTTVAIGKGLFFAVAPRGREPFR